jgi:6,7-dimethyl-8-ribityllumazine synthase
MSLLPTRISILAAEFNKSIIDTMISEAQKTAREAGITDIHVIKVAGCYEIPLIAELELSRSDTGIVVALGYIERGETLHGEVMGNVVHQALVQLQLKHHKPVGIGIIGPGATEEQAQARKVDYAQAAVRASLKNWSLLQGSQKKS